MGPSEYRFRSGDQEQLPHFDMMVLKTNGLRSREAADQEELDKLRFVHIMMSGPQS